MHLLNKMPEKQQIQKLKSPGYVLSSSVERRWWPDASSGDRPGGALETRHACGGWGPFFVSDFAPAATMKDTWFYGPATVPTPRCKSCPSPRVPLLERVMLDNRFNFVVVAGTALMRMVMVMAPGYIHPDEFFQAQEVAAVRLHSLGRACRPFLSRTHHPITKFTRVIVSRP